MAGINPDSMIVRESALPTGEIDGELVALDIERGECFGLDTIGADIWRLAEQPQRVGDLVDQLVATYEVERDQCLADIQRFLAELAELGMIRVVRE